MKTHIQLCPKNRKSKLDKSQTFLVPKARSEGGEGEKTLGMAKYNEKKIRAALARMVIVDELPFRCVEGEGFREFVKALDPRFPIPSRFTVMRDCMRVFLREKDSLKKMFLTTKQRVCLTTDTWTSIQNINYMCVTAHFIDNNWKLHKRIISFVRISDHKGATIGRELEECMLDWGIDKILTITVDNATSNDSAIDWLRTREIGSADCIANHEFIHMRCTAHILNLIVSEGLKDVDDSIVRVRNLIKYVKSSPQRLATFKSCVDRSKVQCSSFLTLDVPTRWNSTFLMLDVAEKYQKAFQLLLDEDPYSRVYLSEDGHGRKGLGAPGPDDWETIRNFSKFLQIFYGVTLRISGTLYVTSNNYVQELIAIHKHLNNFCDNSNRRLSSMAFRMKTKYNKYWGDLEKINRLLFIAAILDPRFKLVTQAYWFKKTLGEAKGEEFVALLKRDMEYLYEAYVEFGDGCVTGANKTQSGEASASMGSSSTVTDYDPLDFLREFHKEHTASLMDCKSELERYLLENIEIPTGCFDILIWWKVNSTKYPILALMARDILAIPITTVASESAFSTGGLYSICLSQNYSEAIDDAESYKLDSELANSMANILREED
ncbi:hypothetical protein I3843_14G123500 [Carya illinoinensis]|nr:hypothetical protein I3843_14G123500 [Carya illinoinensis]